MSKKTKSPASPTFLFLFRNAADQPDPSPEQMQAIMGKWMAWMDKMKAKGQLLGGEPLEDKPARVLRGERGSNVTDGPYVEAKEVVGGYLLIAAKSFAAATTLAKGCPIYAGGGNVEVRQIMPMPM